MKCESNQSSVTKVGPFIAVNKSRAIGGPKDNTVALSISMDDFGRPFVRPPGDRASFSDAAGAHFSAHSSRLGLSPAPHGALFEDLGIDGLRESVRIRGKRRPDSAGVSGSRGRRGRS